MPAGEPAAALTLDTTDFRGAVRALPERLMRLLEGSTGLDGLPEHDVVANVLIIGVGDAALEGDLVAAFAGPFCAVPIVVHRGGDLPSFVDVTTLVVVISTSGDDDEASDAIEEARAVGAPMVVVASKGPIGDMALAHDVPLVTLPDELVAPRLLPGVVALPVLLVLEQVGELPGAAEWAAQAVERIRERRDELAGVRNPAVQLARRIGRTMPIVYGGGELGGVAARWWKSSCNQGAKLPAFANTVPDLCHDEIAGFGQNGDVTRQVFTLVLLRHDHEHPRVGERFDQLPDLLDEVVSGIEVLEAVGDGALSQVLDLAYLGAHVGVELAAIAGVDPGPVPIIDELRRHVTLR